jgi:hypothetical protein
MSDREIENIVSNERLFDGVMSKIAAAQPPAPVTRSSFAWMPVLVSAALAVAVAIPLLAYLGTSVAGDETAFVVSEKAPAVYTGEETNYKADEIVKKDDPQPAADESVPTPTYATMTRTVDRPAPKRTVQRPETVRVQPAPEPAFMPISLPEKAEDAAIDGRVVRVEIPRAALFAMGVNVPLENGTRDVRAELLLGADGVPKAIRLVE